MDRKKATRDYKDTPRPMGVYRVRNRAARRSLLGSSVDVPSILNRHRAQLRMGLHPDQELQRDWKALGPGGFDFEVLDTLEPPDRAGYDAADDLRALEQLWREKLTAAGEAAYTGKPGRRG